MTEKEKPQGLAADGAEVDAGITDMNNGNTPQQPVSIPQAENGDASGAEPEAAPAGDAVDGKIILPATDAYGNPIYAEPDDSAASAPARKSGKGKSGKSKSGAKKSAAPQPASAGQGFVYDGTAEAIQAFECSPGNPVFTHNNTPVVKVPRTLYEDLSYDVFMENVVRFTLDNMGGGFDWDWALKRSDVNIAKRRDELFRKTVDAVNFHNGKLGGKKGPGLSVRYPIPLVLDDIAICECLVRYHLARRVNVNVDGGNGTRLILFDGREWLTTDDDFVYELVRRYSPGCKKKRIDEEIIPTLESAAPIVELDTQPDHVYYLNCMFDYGTKERLYYDDPAYDPEQHVCLGVFRVNLPEQPHNVEYVTKQGQRLTAIGAIENLHDDPALTKLTLQMMCAMLRPYRIWNKSFWLMDEGTGQTGKGMTCGVMESLAGPVAYKSLNMAQMSKDFNWNGVERWRLIVGHENVFGKWLDDQTNYKRSVTNDSLFADRKHKPGYDARFFGINVQCINKIPQTADRTGSFWRRIVIIPYEKVFMGDDDDSAVKDVFLKSAEALEDIVYYLMYELEDFDELDVPEACKIAMDKTIAENSSAVAFFSDVFLGDGDGVKAGWNAYPIRGYLYEAYLGWYRAVIGRGSLNGAMKETGFKAELFDYVEKHPDCGWETWTKSAFAFGAVGAPGGADPMLDEYCDAPVDVIAANKEIRGIRRIGCYGHKAVAQAKARPATSDEMRDEYVDYLREYDADGHADDDVPASYDGIHRGWHDDDGTWYAFHETLPYIVRLGHGGDDAPPEVMQPLPYFIWCLRDGTTLPPGGLPVVDGDPGEAFWGEVDDVIRDRMRIDTDALGKHEEDSND